eukprot:3528439-Amphidinium_carterae.1
MSLCKGGLSVQKGFGAGTILPPCLYAYIVKVIKHGTLKSRGKTGAMFTAFLNALKNKGKRPMFNAGGEDSLNSDPPDPYRIEH